MSFVNGTIPCLGELTAARSLRSKPPACDFAEGRVWEALGGGWQCLHGCYCQRGVSVEWHDFAAETPRDWARSFHPGSVELCLNVAGHARFADDRESMLLGPASIGLYAAAEGELSAWRLAGEQHQFLTVEYSPQFLARHLTGHEAELHPVVRQALRPRKETPKAAWVARLTTPLRKRIARLRLPPVAGPAAALWYQSQALELLAEFCFAPAASQSGMAQRRQQVSERRVESAIQILRQRLAEPPALGELGRIVGCSPYHLSRTFSRVVGMTIPQYLRQIRMERAAELLKSGKFNVTEAALEVGYQSLSHFSLAFCETLGCCPGLYPLGLTRPASPQSGAARPPASAIRRQ